MKLQKYLLPLSTAALLCSSVTWGADKDSADIDKRIDNSAKVLSEIMATPDKSIPDKIMNDARCVAVIPSMVKIAVGFGCNMARVPTLSVQNETSEATDLNLCVSE